MASATSKKVRKATAGKAAVKGKGPATKARAGKAKAKASPARKAKHPAEPERSSPAVAEVDAAALEFIAAIERFKQQHGRPFPSWSEVLLVVRELGYRRD